MGVQYKESPEFQTDEAKEGFWAKKGSYMKNGTKFAMPALVAVFLSIFLVSSSFGQEAGPSSEHLFNLEYTPGGFSLTVGVEMWEKNERFEKELQLGEGRIVRGLLPTGSEEKDHTGFAWDQSNARLYLDLNRNGDLTDDPKGVFESEQKGSYQIFRDILLKVQADPVEIEYAVQMSMYGYGNQPNGQINVHSGFKGQIELYGKKWNIAVVDNMDGKLGPSDGLFLTPFVKGAGKDYVNDRYRLNIPERVFFDGHNYSLSFKFEPGETAPLLHAP